MTIEKFQLRKVNEKSISIYLIPHWYRNTQHKGLPVDTYITTWRDSAKNQICKEFTSKLTDRIKDESMITLHPPSHCDIFVNDLKSYINSTFPNSIDISSIFWKDEGVELGVEEYKKQELKELVKYFHIKDDFELEFDKSTQTLLIYDDVESSLKTIKIMKHMVDKIGITYDKLIIGHIVKVTK